MAVAVVFSAQQQQVDATVKAVKKRLPVAQQVAVLDACAVVEKGLDCEQVWAVARVRQTLPTAWTACTVGAEGEVAEVVAGLRRATERVAGGIAYVAGAAGVERPLKKRRHFRVADAACCGQARNLP